ncbi:MAG: hypothetical protein N2691_06015 [Patescibacteria group bacterium]|nr:hypothetical protein [Patescibacteria group bacterium]
MQEIQAFADRLHLTVTILLVIMAASAMAIPVVVFTVRKKFLYASAFAALSCTSFIAAVFLSTIEPFSNSFNRAQIGVYIAQTTFSLAVIIVQILFSAGIIVFQHRR